MSSSCKNGKRAAWPAIRRLIARASARAHPPSTEIANVELVKSAKRNNERKPIVVKIVVLRLRIATLHLYFAHWIAAIMALVFAVEQLAPMKFLGVVEAACNTLRTQTVRNAFS